MKALFITLLLAVVVGVCDAQWFQQNSGTTADLFSVAFSDSNHGVVVGDSGLILQTTNGGLNWMRRQSRRSLALTSVYFLNPSNGWVVGYAGDSVLYTSDGGINWVPRGLASGNYLRSVYFVNQNIGCAGGMQYVLWGNRPCVSYTTDGGFHWTRAAWDSTDLGGGFVSSIHFSDESHGWLVRNEDDLLYDSSNFLPQVARTTDGGRSWMCVQLGNVHITSMEIVGLNNIWLVGSTSDSARYILHSTNAGNSWNALIGRMRSSLQSVCFVDTVNGWAIGRNYDTSVIHQSDTSVILRTTNGGIDWKEQYRMPVSLSDAGFRSISFVDVNNGWVVGSNGVILHTTNGGLTFVESSTTGEVPETYALKQNYPNPFNPATNISFSLPSKFFVTLKVFDIMGREVATIVAEDLLAGSYLRQWNAANMSSGIYFYRLHAGSFTETKKLVLLR